MKSSIDFHPQISKIVFDLEYIHTRVVKTWLSTQPAGRAEMTCVRKTYMESLVRNI